MGRQLPSWFGFVGQRDIVSSLKAHCCGAKEKGTAVPPIKLGDESGVGKTHLARAVASEMGTTCHEFYSSRASRKYDIVETMAKIKAGDILFVDEAHSLPVDSQEVLYKCISDHERPELDVEKHRVVETEWVAMPAFTLIIATDQPGVLRNALKKRIVLSYTLTRYSVPEMRVIVGNYATELQLLVNQQARTRIAGAARGIPRLARHLLVSIDTVLGSDRNIEVTKPFVVRHLWAHHKIDNRNLNADDRHYIRSLQDRGGRMSKETLALQLGLDVAAIQRDIEPHLMREGYVDIRSGGRFLTPSGKALDVQKEVR